MNKIKIGNKCFVTENARVQLGLAEGDVYEVFNILKEAFRPIILKRGCDLIGRVGANEIILIKDIVLTTYQKDFLLNNFFENTSYAGWRGIATTLLETGECVVAGDKCIWVGGIGDFIEIKKAEGFFGCVVYKFNLGFFLSSDLFKEYKESEIKDTLNQMEELTTKYADLYRL